MLAQNVIIIWPGTNASIPSGFTRETSLDGKHPKGTAASTNPNVTGGSATHSHTSSAHTHTMVSHSHSGTTAGGGTREDADAGPGIAQDNHTHNYNISGVSSGSLSNTVTYASTSSEPAYYKVIFIKAGGFKAVPTSAVVLWNSASVPTGYGECDGAGGRPDLRNKFLKGADTSGDGGATGGTANHEHSINHTHTGVTHGHNGTSGSSNNMTSGGSGGAQVTSDHTHDVSLSAAGAETGSAYTGNAGSADTVEPSYRKLMAIQNTGGASIYKGTIALWLGDLANIPIGWSLCDGTNGTPDMRDRFMKVANDSSQLGNTGGSNTHGHAASNSHTHTASGTHTHTGTTSSVSASYGTGVGGNGGANPHSHTISSASSAATSSWNNTTVTADSVDGQPEFRTVAYIQYQFSVGAAVMMGML